MKTKKRFLGMLIALVVVLTLAMGLDGTALAATNIVGCERDLNIGDEFKSSDNLIFTLCTLYYNSSSLYVGESKKINFQNDLGVPANSSVRVSAVDKESKTISGNTFITIHSVTFEDIQSPNPITYSNQSVSKTFSTSAQTANLSGASNAEGNVTYSITSQKYGCKLFFSKRNNPYDPSEYPRWNVYREG